MGSDIRETTLGALLAFSNGHSSPGRADYLPYPVYGSNGVIGRTDTANAEAGSIVIGRVGSQCGSLYFSRQPCWVTDNAIRATALNNNDPRFLFYLLSTLELNGWRTGSGQPLLNQDILSHVPANVPPVPEQRAIGGILGALDDKIELNRRMNETLEAMARALFKSWFIDFDPVHAKAEGRDPGLPADIAALFPDSFEDSELGEIPTGWKTERVEDIAEVSSGKRPGVRYSEASAQASVPLWGGNGPMAFVPEALIDYPFLLTGRVGTLGSVFRIPEPCWPSDNTLVLKTKQLRAYEYLFLQLKRVDFMALNRGSTQPLLTQTDLKAQPLVIPPAVALECFHVFAGSVYKQVDKLESESRTLASVRNTLLPKLLSGDLRVKDVEHPVEASS